MGFLNTILDIVFPENCLGCNKSGAYLCEICLAGAPEAERPTLAWIYPMYDYRHPAIKKSIAFLKYKGRKKIVDVFADVLYGRILEELSDLSAMENFRSPILAPIPLSPRRHKERGFNQAELLCRKIKSLDKDGNFTFMENILIKPRDTRHQAEIKDRSARLLNLAGTFSLNPKRDQDILKGKNIILVDDVTTTGATLLEARKVLKSAGARKVIAFTIAH